MLYEMIDSPANGTSGQYCGTFSFADLPDRFREAIRADPQVNEWRLPALSGGDSGEELTDLTTLVRRMASVSYALADPDGFVDGMTES